MQLDARSLPLSGGGSALRARIVGLALCGLAACTLACRTESGLARRVAELEARLDEEIALSDAVAERRQVQEVAVVTALLDGLDLQGLTTRLAAGKAPRAVDSTAVEGLARALKHADWPPELLTESENMARALDALGAALGGEDVERAAALAPRALAFQLELRRATGRWMNGLGEWTPRAPTGHVHGAGAGHPPAAGGP